MRTYLDLQHVFDPGADCGDRTCIRSVFGRQMRFGDTNIAYLETSHYF